MGGLEGVEMMIENVDSTTEPGYQTEEIVTAPPLLSSVHSDANIQGVSYYASPQQTGRGNFDLIFDRAVINVEKRSPRLSVREKSAHICLLRFKFRYFSPLF